VPAVAYGPRSRNIHGTDEAVELASIVSGARALARFMAGFFAAGSVEGGSVEGGSVEGGSVEGGSVEAGSVEAGSAEGSGR
jgi:hypothetical protein